MQLLQITFLFFFNCVHGFISFSSPQQDEAFAIDDYVTVTLSGLTGVESATVTQICATEAQVSKLFTTIDYSQNFNLPTGYSGGCTYTATMTGSSTPEASVRILVGNPVPVTIDVPVSGSSVTSGESFDIELSYSPSTTPNVVFDVQLDCQISGIDPVVQQVVGNAQIQNYLAPDTFYGNNCILSVLDTVQGYYGFAPVSIKVIKDLILEFPLAGSNQQVGVPFNTLVSATGLDRYVVVTLFFNNIPRQATVNIDHSIALEAFYLGVVTLTVSSSSPFVSPPPISFNLKYGLEFTEAPKFIFKNVPFQIYLTTSATPIAPADQTVLVSLTCGAELIDQWTVPLNELVTLSTIEADIPAQSICSLSTPSDNMYYYTALHEVIIFRTPFDVQVQILNSLEKDAFAKRIAFPLSDYYKKHPKLRRFAQSPFLK